MRILNLLKQFFWLRKSLHKINGFISINMEYFKTPEAFDQYAIKEKNASRSKEYFQLSALLVFKIAEMFDMNVEKQTLLNLAYLSILAPFFDDQFDHNSKNIADLILQIESPNYGKDKNHELAFSSSIYKKLLLGIPNKDKFIALARKMFQIQQESCYQKCIEVSDNELYEICIEKGGVACELYWSTTSEDNNIAYNITYSLGGLLQMLDDLLDVYDDLNEGIKTYANQVSFDHFLKVVSAKYVETKDLLKQVPCEGKSKAEYQDLLGILYSAFFVIIKHYKKIRCEEINKPSRLLQCKREEVIFDMENPKNLLNFIKEYHKRK